jgi:DNA-binding MarR family transcriptional regulator
MTSHPSHRPVSALRARMIEDMRVRGFTEKTRNDYVRNVRAFAAFIGRSPDTATAEDLRCFQLHQTQTGMQPPSINSAVVALKVGDGFSAAARHLNVSTTTVSDQVQALENTLGVRLLNRTTRRVSLTEIGRDYYERCSQILQELAEADEAASALQVTPRGRLRVYCQQGLSRLVALVTTHFLRDYPEVSMDLLTGDTMIDLVQEGFDLAIMPTSPPLPGRAWNKRLKESHKFMRLLLGKADMRVERR